MYIQTETEVKGSDLPTEAGFSSDQRAYKWIKRNTETKKKSDLAFFAIYNLTSSVFIYLV